MIVVGIQLAMTLGNKVEVFNRFVVAINVGAGRKTGLLAAAILVIALS